MIRVKTGGEKEFVYNENYKAPELTDKEKTEFREALIRGKINQLEERKKEEERMKILKEEMLKNKRKAQIWDIVKEWILPLFALAFIISLIYWIL